MLYHKWIRGHRVSIYNVRPSFAGSAVVPLFVDGDCELLLLQLCRASQERSGQEDVGQRHGDTTVVSPHNEVAGCGPAVVRDGPASVLPGVNYPNIGDSEGDIVVDTVLHRGHGVIGRHNLDTEPGWTG